MGALAPRSPPPPGSTTGYRLMVQVLAHTENNILILTSSISGTVSGNRLGYGMVYLEIGGGTWVQGERGRGVGVRVKKDCLILYSLSTVSILHCT